MEIMLGQLGDIKIGQFCTPLQGILLQGQAEISEAI